MGCRTVKPIVDNNNKILEEKKQLEKDIDILNDINKNLINQSTNLSKKIINTQNQLSSIEKEKALIEESNKQAQEFIAQSEQLAKEKAKAIYQNELSE